MPSNIDSIQQNPTLFHITNYKAGSQWIYGILRDLFDNNKIIKPLPKVNHILNSGLKDGYIYPTVYLDYDKFQKLKLPKNYKYLIIFRDLRDVLVSLYFSLLKSHPEVSDTINKRRSKLKSMSFEDGILHLMETSLLTNATIQSSWAREHSFIKYEDLLSNDFELLRFELIDKLKFNIDEKRLENAIKNNRFDQLTNGRKQGNEDQTSHYRKGIKGDWKNYFTPKIKDKFKELYGEHLILMNYEENLNW